MRRRRRNKKSWRVWFFITNSQNIYTKIGIFLQTASVLSKASFWLHKLSGSSNSYLSHIIKAAEAETNEVICTGCPSRLVAEPRRVLFPISTLMPEPVLHSHPSTGGKTFISASETAAILGIVFICGIENWPDNSVSADKCWHYLDLSILWKDSAADWGIATVRNII